MPQQQWELDNADVIGVKFDDIHALADQKDVGFVVMEIGQAGALKPDNLVKSVKAFEDAIAYFPSAELTLTIGGYDDDPREMFEIPEAVCYVTEFWRLVSHQQDIARRLDPGTLEVIRACLNRAAAAPAAATNRQARRKAERDARKMPGRKR